MAMPAEVSLALSPMSWASLAMPKSQIFTVPSVSRITLAGFRSRWMMPCSWV